MRVTPVTRGIVAVGAAAALIAGTGVSSAAPKPQITDVTGDYSAPSADIVSGTLTVTNKSKTRKVLTISLKLAAAPTTSNPHTYSVRFKAGECAFSAVYYGHPADDLFSTSGVGCDDGSGTLPEGEVAVSGSSIVWKVPLTGTLKPKTKVTELSAHTQPGGVTSGGAGELVGDAAEGTDWILG